MAKFSNKLKVTTIKNFKAKDKDYVEADGDGLYLKITKSGSKIWFFRYFSPIDGKDRKLTIQKHIQGKTELNDIRDIKRKYLSMIEKGLDPIEEKKKDEIVDKQKRANEKKTNFINLFEEFLEKRQYEKSLTDRTISDIRKKYNNHIYPYLPSKQDTILKDVKYDFLVECLKRLEDADTLETLKKIKNYLILFYKYLSSEKIYKNYELITDLESKSFKKRHKRDVNHLASFINDADIKKLLNDSYSYNGMEVTKFAILISFHIMLRQGSMIKAEWTEIDFDKKLWIVPAERMKNRKEFLIPLTTQVIELLKSLKEITGHTKYLFANTDRTLKPINDDSVNNAFRMMGYEKGTVTAHGLRTTFSTLANENIHEHRVSPAIVEKILAHKVGSEVKLTYDKSENIIEKRKLLEWWSNYLINLISDNN